jgi:hypothetical protein
VSRREDNMDAISSYFSSGVKESNIYRTFGEVELFIGSPPLEYEKNIVLISSSLSPP